MAGHSLAHTAEATVRAGFMLMPEYGASKVMYVATNVPATNGVSEA